MKTTEGKTSKREVVSNWERVMKEIEEEYEANREKREAIIAAKTLEEFRKTLSPLEKRSFDWMSEERKVACMRVQQRLKQPVSLESIAKQHQDCIRNRMHCDPEEERKRIERFSRK